MLESGVSRRWPLLPTLAQPVILLYTDADGSGRLGAVAEFPSGTKVFLRGVVPGRVRRMLQKRRTQIVAFEILAAVVGILSLCPERLRGMKVVHFIDSVAALGSIIKGFSRQEDLALVVGRLWFEASELMLNYTAQFVPTHLNLADGPSRDDVALLTRMGARELHDWSFPHFGGGLGDWMASLEHVGRITL